MTQPEDATPRGDDLRADPDVPRDIRYDPDLAVHEPMEVPAEPVVPSRRRSPLVLFVLGAAGLAFLVYALFGLIASEGKTSADYLADIRLRPGGAWQAAFELSRLVAREPPARRDPGFTPRLLALFEEARGGDPRLRRYLALALKELRDPRSLDALVAAVRDDPDVETRLYAAWALGLLGDPRARPALEPLLESHEPDLRKIAVFAIGRLDGAPGTAEILAPMIHDPVEDVAWNAALALARHGDRRGLALLRRMLDRSYLDRVTRPDEQGVPRRLTEAQKEEAMLTALGSLARLGDASDRAPVRRLQETDPNLRVRQAARETLASLAGSLSE
jgi:hypothetical protein